MVVNIHTVSKLKGLYTVSYDKLYLGYGMARKSRVVPRSWARVVFSEFNDLDKYREFLWMKDIGGVGLDR